MNIRGFEFDFSKTTYIMGILNVTPDSFSDGGLHNTPEKALGHALKMIEEGASIIDIGGESTRPGHTPVDADEQIRRVIPVIKSLREVSDIPISIDTTDARVAAEAINAGADIVNSVAGLATGDDMIKVIKDSGAYFIATYEGSYVNQFAEALIEMAERLTDAGIPEDKIIVDPGVGFGKTFEDNLKIVNDLPHITQIGYPVLLGCSRKSFIGKVLDATEDERLSGTIVTSVLAALAGVGMIRVHDVKENKRAVQMLEAVCSADRKKEGTD